MTLKNSRSEPHKVAAIMKVLAAISAGMTLIAALFLPAVLHRDGSSRWPTATGVIETNSLRFWGGKPSQPAYYKPAIAYSYTVDGIRHVGTRINFSDSSPTLEKDEATAWLDKHYPVGKQVIVYYDRANPDLATLVPGAKELVFLCLYFVGTAAFCFVASWFLFRRYKQKADSI
jgi:hypothetical protein